MMHSAHRKLRVKQALDKSTDEAQRTTNRLKAVEEYDLALPCFGNSRLLLMSQERLSVAKSCAASCAGPVPVSCLHYMKLSFSLNQSQHRGFPSSSPSWHPSSPPSRLSISLRSPHIYFILSSAEGDIYGGAKNPIASLAYGLCSRGFEGLIG